MALDRPFQSTHPRGVRPRMIFISIISSSEFQSTHPRGVRQSGSTMHLSTVKFQSTHPRGVRRQRSGAAWPMESFNPRTREGCDKVAKPVPPPTPVSIHAPARGATLRQMYMRHGCLFQSTHPRGVRRDRFRWRDHSRRVSIHAPARGATERVRAIGWGKKFQSTHPRGVRPRVLMRSTPDFLFQSTHPRGVRRPRQPEDGSRDPFQSTHPRGVRHGDWYSGNPPYGVSIHAPARGATTLVNKIIEHYKVSIHAPARGATAAIHGVQQLGKFQSTHPRGVRQL